MIKKKFNSHCLSQRTKRLLSGLFFVAFVFQAFAYMAEVDGIYYDFYPNDEVTVVPNNSTDKRYRGNIVIPQTITYMGRIYNVTSIGYNAFNGCSDLTSITIPSSVTSIGSEAFSGCSSLTSVELNCKSVGSSFYNMTSIKEIKLGDNVTSIGYDAFAGCSGLTSISIPSSVTSIADCAFAGCSGLTSVTIPSSVTSIGECAFSGTEWYDSQDDGLVYAGNVAYKYKGTMPEGTKIIIKPGTTSISPGAFYECTGLASVVIPNSVTSIGDHAFNLCTGLTSVVIPNSVTSIGDDAFRWCTGLTSVTIGNSVTSIGRYAFGNCSILYSVTCLNTTPPQGYKIFDWNNTQVGWLIVPTGCKEIYKQHWAWREIKELDVTAIKSLINEDPCEDRIVYDLKGERMAADVDNIQELPKGVYFVPMSNGTTRKVYVK